MKKKSVTITKRKEFVRKFRKLCNDYNMVVDTRARHVYVRKAENNWDSCIFDLISHPKKSVVQIGLNLLKE